MSYIRIADIDQQTIRSSSLTFDTNTQACGQLACQNMNVVSTCNQMAPDRPITDQRCNVEAHFPGLRDVAEQISQNLQTISQTSDGGAGKRVGERAGVGGYPHISAINPQIAQPTFFHFFEQIWTIR
jgi:hypothetical protein